MLRGTKEEYRKDQETGINPGGNDVIHTVTDLFDIARHSIIRKKKMKKMNNGDTVTMDQKNSIAINSAISNCYARAGIIVAIIAINEDGFIFRNKTDTKER